MAPPIYHNLLTSEPEEDDDTCEPGEVDVLDEYGTARQLMAKPALSRCRPGVAGSVAVAVAGALAVLVLVAPLPWSSPGHGLSAARTQDSVNENVFNEDSLPRWGNEHDVGTDQCASSSTQCCSQSVLGTETATCKDVTSQTLTSAWQDLPPQLQGVFWLEEQQDASAIMSFGQTADGCGLSPGSIGSDAIYRVRVSGDRSWAFHTNIGSFMSSEVQDVVYEFQFDSATDPKFAKIIPEARAAFGSRIPSWLMSYTMSLMEPGNGSYQDSVVWHRTSSVLGMEATDYHYHLTQVIDGAGRRLPAFEDWVKYCEDPAHTGESSPGHIWFHASAARTQDSVNEEASIPTDVPTDVPTDQSSGTQDTGVPTDEEAKTQDTDVPTDQSSGNRRGGWSLPRVWH